MREAENISWSTVVGAYVIRTSSLNDKHSCQLFRMGLRDKTAPTLTTPLIRADMSCVVTIIFSSLAFLSSSVAMVNLSHLVAASFSSLPILSSSVSMANLSLCYVATTFISLRFPSKSLSSPRFNLLRMVRRFFLVVFCFLIFASYPQPFFPQFFSLWSCLL